MIEAMMIGLMWFAVGVYLGVYLGERRQRKGGCENGNVR